MSELHRLRGPLSKEERERLHAKGPASSDPEALVTRSDGRTVNLAALDDLMKYVRQKATSDEWPERSVSDRWLAPRLHYALRLNRAEAADRGMWLWLALRYAWYLSWRWQDEKKEGAVAEDRWYGPVHKQAFARLWWGAELFRDGGNYGPVERAFIRQDFPNSYLHRPLVRCRSLALALLEVIAPERGDEVISSKAVNDLARVLNLAVAGSPPEIETGFKQDDRKSYVAWIEQDVVRPPDWEASVQGPPAQDTTPDSRAGGKGIAERGRRYAERARGAVRVVARKEGTA